jgi:hypothetical protein
VARNDEQKEPTTSSHLTLLNSASHIIHRHLFHSRSEQALQRLTTAAAPAAVAAPARPPSPPSLPLPPPAQQHSCPYLPRLTDRTSDMRALHISTSCPATHIPRRRLTRAPSHRKLCRSYFAPTLSSQHSATAYCSRLAAARLERQRKPRRSCCTAALLLHVALACPRRPPARCGLGSLWAACAVSC